MTTQDAQDAFLAALLARDASPETIRSYRTTLGAYAAWLSAQGLDWSEVGRLDVRQYIAVLREGRSASTVAQRIACLRSFARWAVRWDLLPSSPWSAIRPPKQPRRLPRFLSREEIDRLIAACGVPGEVGGWREPLGAVE